MATLAAAPVPDLYVPRLVRVLETREETAEKGPTKRVVTLRLERQGLEWAPGQFLQVGVFGAGEVPISISSPPSLADTLLLTVRAAGAVTTRLAASRPGDVLGVRGPFGRPFDLHGCAGRDALFVAGGIGLAPLRSVLWEMLLAPGRFGRVLVLHGARSPHDLLYPWQYREWQERGADVRLAVDRGDGAWEKGEDPPRTVGFLPALFPHLGLEPARTTAFLCGPPVMIRVACEQLTRTYGLPPSRCFATLERHMKCGVGKCGHCVVVDRYVCVDGPVFAYDELLALARIEPPW